MLCPVIAMNKFLRITFLIFSFSAFSGLSLAPEMVPVASYDKKSSSSLDDLSFSVCDQNDVNAFLSSPKEDLTVQYHQHKVKISSANLCQSAIINYRVTHLFYQRVQARSFTLGGTTALRAPPSVSLS